MSIRLKRIYEKPARADGFRVLVDRLWPRGISKEKARLDSWAKELAPSNELRRWYHKGQRFTDFRNRYQQELDSKHQMGVDLLNQAGDQDITLLYAAKDTAQNHAIILQNFLLDKK